jgi:hypothetical protein
MIFETTSKLLPRNEVTSISSLNDLNGFSGPIKRSMRVYLLVAIGKKRLGLQHDLYTLLQILSLTLFEKTPLIRLFHQSDHTLGVVLTPNY